MFSVKRTLERGCMSWCVAPLTKAYWRNLRDPASSNQKKRCNWEWGEDNKHLKINLHQPQWHKHLRHGGRQGEASKQYNHRLEMKNKMPVSVSNKSHFSYFQPNRTNRCCLLSTFGPSSRLCLKCGRTLGRKKWAGQGDTIGLASHRQQHIPTVRKSNRLAGRSWRTGIHYFERSGGGCWGNFSVLPTIIAPQDRRLPYAHFTLTNGEVSKMIATYEQSIGGYREECIKNR